MALLAIGSQAAAIDTKLAARYFQEAQWASDDDGGKLWGKPVYGPMIFVDPRSRYAVANVEPEGMGFKPQDGVFAGKLPDEVLIANTAFDWRGKKWSMVMWGAVSETYAERMRLILHEAFHRMQEEVGLPPGTPRNAHLDILDGRIWMLLEVAALRQAMLAQDAATNKPFVEDALVFRAYRQSLFPGAKAEEDRMETNEGMAEYTGLRLRGTWQPEIRHSLGYRMRLVESKASLPTAFAYDTGAAFGLLLDLDEEPWRPVVKPDSSLTDMIRTSKRYRFDLPTDLKAAAMERMKRYDGEALIDREKAREQKRRDTEAAHRKLYIEGPLLELPMGEGMGYTYNPNNVFPLGPEGTIYPQATASWHWGKLTASTALRMAADFSKVWVPAPASADARSGAGWTLSLNPGWKIVQGERKGDYKVVKG